MGVSGGLSMTYLVNFSILPCLRLCVGGWFRGLPDTSFLLGFGNAVFWFGAYVCFACKGIVYARAEHLAFLLLGLIAFIAAASPLRHDRHTC